MFRFLLVVLLIFILAIYGIGEMFDRDEHEGVITVEGSGEVELEPDMATLTFTLKREAKEATAAKKQVDRLLGEVRSMLDDMKIDEADLKTLQVNLQPKYRYLREESRQEKIGYTATQRLQLEVNDLEKLGDVLEQLVKRGIDQTDQVQFGVSNRSEAADEATIRAVEDARARAESVAEELGVEIEGVLKVNLQNRNFHFPQPVYMARGMSADAMVSEKAVAPPKGEMKVTQTVSIEFAIE